MCVSIRSSSFSFDRYSHSLFIHVCCVAQGQSHSDGFALLFTAIARLVKAGWIDRSGSRDRRLGVGTDHKTRCRHTCLHRTQSSSHEVAQLHEHSETGQSAKNSQQRGKVSVESKVGECNHWRANGHSLQRSVSHEGAPRNRRKTGQKHQRLPLRQHSLTEESLMKRTVLDEKSLQD